MSEFDAYPMPHEDELIENLAGFITTLGLTKGYWQVPLAAGSKEKTAFATPGDLWQFPDDALWSVVAQGIEQVHWEPQGWWFESRLPHVSSRSVPEQDT